jgi:hypothetical protein
MRRVNFSGWHTGYERRFLEGLGTHASTGKTRTELLYAYIRAMSKRADWDDMDSAIVSREARAMYLAETGKMAKPR